MTVTTFITVKGSEYIPIDWTFRPLFYANNLCSTLQFYTATAPPGLTKVVPCIHPTLELDASLCSVALSTEIQGDVNHYHIKGNYHKHNAEVGE